VVIVRGFGAVVGSLVQFGDFLKAKKILNLDSKKPKLASEPETGS
jgi:hypothetical protein